MLFYNFYNYNLTVNLKFVGYIYKKMLKKMCLKCHKNILNNIF